MIEGRFFGDEAMGDTGTSLLLTSWRTLFETGSVAAMTDAMLLEQFATRREAAGEAAFAALVARHGPMVRKVCRRLLDDPHDADDAFQATFFVLARKARAIRRPDRLASWLYGTAYRTSRKLGVQTARRRKHEAAAALAESRRSDDSIRIEEAEILLQELARLPESLRSAIVLCELEGLTQEEAARALGCSYRTLRRRLDRAGGLLRARLLRRGLAPTTALFASFRVPEPAAAAVTTIASDATTRAAVAFAAGEATAGIGPAPAAMLAERVIKAMLSTKIKGSAVAAGVLLAMGIGTGAGLALSSSSTLDPRTRPLELKNDAESNRLQPSPSEQYRALVERYEDDIKAYQAAAMGKSQAEVAEIYKRLGPDLAAYATRFVSLAERYPKDPAAVDALIWVVERTQSASDEWEGPFSRMVGRAMEILTRNHAGEPRLGPLCLRLTGYESPRRDVFLRAIAERSPNRVVKGQATLALAQYLGMKAVMVELIQHPDAPENLEKMKALIISIAGPEALAGSNPPLTEAAASLHKQRQELSQHAPAYLEHLLTADPAAIRRESEQLYARVIKEFGDVPHARFDTRPTRETLADVALRSLRTRPAPAAPAFSFRTLDEAFLAAKNSANQAADKLGPNEAGMRAYIAAAPRWGDFGPKMWKLAEDDPRHPDALEALLWIIGHPVFFDAPEERAATVGKAVDALIRDHLDAIAADLAARNVAEAFGRGGVMPAPHVDRLYRALYERAPSREARGRMGLHLARFLKAEAEMAESLTARGADPGRRPDLAIWAPSYIERQ
jgi:RNA polymerase sigma factor (sigma-70 family)